MQRLDRIFPRQAQGEYCADILVTRHTLSWPQRLAAAVPRRQIPWRVYDWCRVSERSFVSVNVAHIETGIVRRCRHNDQVIRGTLISNLDNELCADLECVLGGIDL